MSDPMFACEMEIPEKKSLESFTYVFTSEITVDSINFILLTTSNRGDDEVLATSGEAQLTRPFLISLRDHLLAGGRIEDFMIIQNFSR